MKIPYYTIYDTAHPSGKAHGGTAVIIKNDIKHYLHSQVRKEYIQATTVTVQTSTNHFQLSAVYVPPRHKITTQMWEEYFQHLGDKFIAAGDYNSKHTLWGSRITSPRGRTLEKHIRNNNLNILSTGRPTYWPTDLSKIPDLLDFAVTKGLNVNKLKIAPSLELNSDHTPIIITYRNKPIIYNNPDTLCNKTTKWQSFKEIIESKINCNIPLKTPEHIEQAVTTLTETIQEAAWASTIPEATKRQTKIIPPDILEKIREKRKAKAKWQKHRSRENKKHLNKLAKEIKNKIKEHNNNEFTKFIETLSAHENSNYSLWKATKKIKKPIKLAPAIRKADNTWARSNEEQAEEFSKHLGNTFTPHIINNSNFNGHTDEDAPTTSTSTDKQYTIPKTTAQEIRNIIEKTKNNKAPGIDLINGKILKNLPPKAIRLMTIIYNAILRIQYYPKLWKLAQIIMLPKPGKDPHQAASYRPISLLPVFSKILEKIIYARLKPIIEKEKLIPDHQFGFRNKHSTIEQMHRLINEIILALENKQYCTALFMDIEKAFDKINHESLLQTIRKQFPEQIYQLIKSYLSSRTFVIKIKDTYSEVKDIKAGVPQGSVLGPILYTLYTANIPTTTNSKILTFADDTSSARATEVNRRVLRGSDL